VQPSSCLLQDQACDNVFKWFAECVQTPDAALKTFVRPLWHHVSIVLLGLKSVVKALLDDVADILCNKHSLHMRHVVTEARSLGEAGATAAHLVRRELRVHACPTQALQDTQMI
jgi:hypothetical protein